jgi:hypothetical protein
MMGDGHMCSSSDEAFTLLLLENSYEHWVAVHKNKIEGATIVDRAVEGRDEKHKEKWESDVSPKYTNGGIIYSEDWKMTHNKDWKDAGIWHFNVLCHRVNRDHVAYPHVLTELVCTWKEGICTNKRKHQLKMLLQVQRHTMNYGIVYQNWQSCKHRGCDGHSNLIMLYNNGHTH